MTEQNTETTLRPEDEFEMLKERAKRMGINVGNAGLETLRKKVNAAAQGEAVPFDTAAETASEDESEEPAAPRPMTKAERQQKLRQDIQREGLALVRCRIYNLNPGKRDLQGEIITVGNKYLGTVKKFIPFGEATDGGYHIPRCIYNNLVSRKFQQIRSRKNPQTKVDEITTRLVPEYSIEILPPLTEVELKELAPNAQVR